MRDAMRAPWIAGDFAALAREIRTPEGLCRSDRARTWPRVLDIACRTGNAIPLARRGATVTGLDMTPDLLEEARARKQAALLHDLEQLWIDNNLATNGENHTLISNEYLEALGMRR
jgi:2-polyprenyl-3-methyl-5-hydroxy-6-metoxy-1,4-benzoquinol methylase